MSTDNNLSSQTEGLLSRLSARVRLSFDADRRRQPERFIASTDGLGSNFMFVENVARMLGCHVDFVRRIPRRELSASKVASRMIYAREDVEAYICSKRDVCSSSYRGAFRGVPLQRVAKSAGDRPGREGTQSPFDPVLKVQSLLSKVQANGEG